MSIADCPDLIHLAGRAIEVRDHREANVGIDLKGLLQRHGVHVPGVALGVDKDRFAVFVGDGIDAGVEGDVRAEDPFAGQCTGIRLRLTVEPLAGQLGRQMQRRRPAGQADCMLAADVFGHLPLNRVDIGADGGDPVGLDGLVHPPLFVAVHGRGTQPDLAGKRPDALESRLG